MWRNITQLKQPNEKINAKEQSLRSYQYQYGRKGKQYFSRSQNKNQSGQPFLAYHIFGNNYITFSHSQDKGTSRHLDHKTSKPWKWPKKHKQQGRELLFSKFPEKSNSPIYLKENHNDRFKYQMIQPHFNNQQIKNLQKILNSQQHRLKHGSSWNPQLTSELEINYPQQQHPQTLSLPNYRPDPKFAKENEMLLKSPSAQDGQQFLQVKSHFENMQYEDGENFEHDFFRRNHYAHETSYEPDPPSDRFFDKMMKMWKKCDCDEDDHYVEYDDYKDYYDDHGYYFDDHGYDYHHHDYYIDRRLDKKKKCDCDDYHRRRRRRKRSIEENSSQRFFVVFQ